MSKNIPKSEKPIDLDKDKRRPPFKEHRIQYQGRCMTVFQWATHLGLSWQGIMTRHQRYGVSPRMFAPKAKPGLKPKRFDLGNSTIVENPEPLTQGSVLRLIAYLIEDAKQEMLVRAPQDLRFCQAQDFLCDEGGALSWWLDLAGDIDVEAARASLKHWATVSYKELRNASGRIQRTR